MYRSKVLLVDDSQPILKALKRVFKPEGYTLFTAGSAKEAMGILKKEAVDLIISDENMPEVSGTELLKHIRLKYPSVIRIMLTGLNDFEVIKNAVNKGEIYKFFNKPWDEFELLLAVKYALIQKNLKDENEKLKSALKLKEETLRQLELEHPGSTKRELTEDGSIIIEVED